MNWALIGAIFLLTSFTAIGDSFLKKAGQFKTTDYVFLLIGIFVYILSGIVWFYVYKQTKFSVAGSIYGVATALIFALVGIFYFKESIKPSEILGIVLAISSMALLGRFGE